MIQAMYLLIGIATISVTIIIERGKNHIALNSWFKIAEMEFALEPFRPDQSHEQVDKQQQ